MSLFTFGHFYPLSLAMFMFIASWIVIHLVRDFSYVSINNLVRASDNDIIMGNTTENIFLFMQISDIHISKLGSDDRAKDLHEFCSVHIPLVKPDLVIASGDLTDGKNERFADSMQNFEEWETYRNILRQTGVLNTTVWLDIRGNHDTFNVPHQNYKGDLYRDYAIQGHVSSKLLTHIVEKPFGKYSFIGLDACQDPGVKFPLNFFGSLTHKQINEIQQVVKTINGSNQTFWFGHYPTSTIVSPDFDLRSILGQTSFAYLCGHLHTFFGLGHRMYALQPQNYWEWELGDWKVSRSYRIVAVDHDLVSFVDKQKFVNEWPIILITNPKSAEFLLPSKEPTHQIKNSSHVRILVWSPWSITRVSVTIDGIPQGNAIPVVTHKKYGKSLPLYVLQWNTSNLFKSDNVMGPKIHFIEVIAEDSHGNRHKVAQPFTFESLVMNTKISFAKFLVSGNHSVIFEKNQMPRLVFRKTSCIDNHKSADSFGKVILFVSKFSMFYGIFLASFIPALCPSLWIMDFVGITFGFASFSGEKLLTRLGLGMYRLSKSNRSLGLIIGYLLYEITCPIFIGYVVGDHIGIVFSYGIYVSGILIPEMLTHFYEFLQLLLFSFQLLLLFLHYGQGYVNRTKFKGANSSLISNESSQPFPQRRTYSHLFFWKRLSKSLIICLIIFTCIQLMFFLFSTSFPYGFLATILCPGRLIPLILAWVLSYLAPDSNKLINGKNFNEDNL